MGATRTAAPLPATVGQGPSDAAARAPLRYCDDLRVELRTVTGDAPHVRTHRVEWEKVMSGDPVEINPSSGCGFKVMTVDEWSSRWKRNEDFPGCLVCGGARTREHYFSQTWCRGKRTWDCESLCLDCLHFSYRTYTDPDFKTPIQYEKERWT